MAELDDHARRVLRSEFASGIVDFPAKKSVVDVEAGFETCAQTRGAEHRSAEEQQGRAAARFRAKFTPLPSSDSTATPA